ncbi:endonuclease VII domain-containing protein [Catellatospora paridis]|uniref:endonuclease VII domain-containing protein n=1 Tax=Catellatospora paridis TaxID=1617086 RepID=UPI001E4EF99C|nr:endonuclease VII domain-containing protein [Catellatospora paridis]
MLSSSQFYSNKSRPDGRSYYCRSCTRARLEGYRRANGVAPQKKADREVPDGAKWCPDCAQIKPIAEFAKSRTKASGLHSYCLDCHNRRGVTTKEKHHGSTREYHLRRRYGMTQEDFETRLAWQGGVCAICGAPDPEHVDHDHEFGNVRGILCFNCNGGLGQFKDNDQSLARAIEYLKETACQLVLVHPGVYQLVSPRRERRLSRTS